MNSRIPTSDPASWTWTEQFSTYRYWGLLLFGLLSAISASVISSFLPVFLGSRLGMQPSRAAIPLAAMAVGGVCGFYLAWATVRWKTLPMLVLAGVLQLLGGLLLTTPALAAAGMLPVVGGYLTGLGAAVILLAIPSVLSGGRGGAEAFVVAYGILFFLSRLVQLYAPATLGRLWDQLGPQVLPATTAGPMVAGLLFLLPVSPALFSEPPSRRDRPLEPRHRSPIGVALLYLVPGYWLYWAYRAHGEIMWLAPTRRILAPRAAVWAAILVPFFVYPVILTSLNDALNEHARQSGHPGYRASWPVCLWGFLFSPVAAGLLQHSMNRAAASPDVQQAGPEAGLAPVAATLAA